MKVSNYCSQAPPFHRQDEKSRRIKFSAVIVSSTTDNKQETSFIILLGILKKTLFKLRDIGIITYLSPLPVIPFKSLTDIIVMYN